MMKTNLYAYDDILLQDIHNDREPDYIYANPTIYDIESNYKVVVNEEGSQLELIDSSNGYLKSIYVSTDMELIRHTENILEFHVKNKENEAKAQAWDKLMSEIDEINDETAGKELSSKIIMAAKITALSNVMKELESGERNAEK